MGEYHHKASCAQGNNGSNAHRFHGEFGVKALLQVPRGYGKRRECAHDKQSVYRVEVARGRSCVERGIEEVGQERLGAVCGKLGACWGLHPRVGDDDPQRREART